MVFSCLCVCVCVCCGEMLEIKCEKAQAYILLHSWGDREMWVGGVDVSKREWDGCVCGVIVFDACSN